MEARIFIMKAISGGQMYLTQPLPSKDRKEAEENMRWLIQKIYWAGRQFPTKAMEAEE